jgi:hypothetical protein
MTKILGLDVCRGSVVGCVHDELHEDCLDWFRQNKPSIKIYGSRREDLDALLALKPDIAILEPTGVHYSRLWADHLIKAGVAVRWIGHAQLKYERLTLRMPNKNDSADACVMAFYGHKHLLQPEYFLRFDIHGVAATMRSLGLQLRHLNSQCTFLVNRLRQQLAHEWPEVHRIKSHAENDTTPPLWRFIAGQQVAKATNTRYSKSLGNTIGGGLSQFSIDHAIAITENENRQIRIAKMLFHLVYSDEFTAYNEVFDLFGFGLRVRAMVLSHIYPLESFLGVNNKPIVEYVDSIGVRQKSKRNRSLAAFKLACGMGLIEDSSGEKEVFRPGGSALVRIALWQWCFVVLESYGGKRAPKNEIAQKLVTFLHQRKAASGSKVKVARSATIARAVELLFKELVDRI